MDDMLTRWKQFIRNGWNTLDEQALSARAPVMYNDIEDSLKRVHHVVSKAYQEAQDDTLNRVSQALHKLLDDLHV